MLLAIMGVAVAFNILVILYKARKSRYIDAAIDAAALIVVAAVFSSSFNALVVGTIGSAIVSIYLLFYPFSSETE